MDKKKIRLFADTVREKLLAEIKKQAATYKISAEDVAPVDQRFEDSIVIQGKVFDKKIEKQRNRLIKEIEEKGYEQVIDEVTYTWFNRFVALKYMEIHEYLPVRVVSSRDAGKIEPDIISEALHLDFIDVDKDTILAYKSKGDTEGLYKYLVLQLCHYLHSIMPFLFEPIGDYTELLFPSRLLHTDSILNDLNTIIDAEDWNEVEIIGWIYQFYVAEKKEKLIRAKKKYKPNEIPAVTQLFTPKWIVKYMVQNTLGRYWLESHPNKELQESFDFYLEPREENYREKLKEYINPSLNPEEITFFDPAMGSGHILVYAFDVFFDIYKSMGYLEEEIPELILTKNLYGLEIDDRASQLASFAVLMKAREYDKNIFDKNPELNLVAIRESNTLSDEDIRSFAGNEKDFKKVKDFFENFINAKIYGSIIKVDEFDKDFFIEKIKIYKKRMNLKSFFKHNLIDIIIKQSNLMGKKYDIVVTNPPYLSSSRFPNLLKKYIWDNYKIGKEDLFSTFIYTTTLKTKDCGQIGLMCPFVWMFIKSYENLRKHIIKRTTFSSFIQLEYSGFEGATVPICSFTLRNSFIKFPGEYIKLSDFIGPSLQPIKTKNAIKDTDVYYRYSSISSDFLKIPGTPISFWTAKKVFRIFEKQDYLNDFGRASEGIKTGNNTLFLRYWFEINFDSMFKGNKWIPHHKGGPFRKWFGNNNWVINWENDGFEIKKQKNSGLQGKDLYFKEVLSWSKITSKGTSLRYLNKNQLFDSGSPAYYSEDNLGYILSFVNSIVGKEFLDILNPTLNCQVGNMLSLPLIVTKDSIIKNTVYNLCNGCIEISKNEWNSKENSWDFTKNELLKRKEENHNLESSYRNYCSYWKNKFFELHQNEKELNKIFIDIYGLNDELTPDVPLEEITILKDETKIQDGDLVFKKDVIIKQFLSYFVGCLMGRYSIDKEGLILANKGETLQDYLNKVPNPSFIPDDDNIIPILDDEYFDDDIITRLKEFLKTTFGEETLSENLQFIADALYTRGKGSAEETIRHYFLKQFYKDHCKMYKKRPIYWMFSSGKQNAFNALIYMHRYNKELLAKLRIDYLHEYQSKLIARKQALPLDSDDIKIRTQAEKEKTDINKKLKELQDYDQHLQNLANKFIDIDLDDGVNENYKKFSPLLEKIK